MVGDQIKFEPAWVSNKNLKENMKALEIEDCTRSPIGILKSRNSAKSATFRRNKSNLAIDIQFKKIDEQVKDPNNITNPVEITPTHLMKQFTPTLNSMRKSAISPPLKVIDSCDPKSRKQKIA